MASNAGGTTMPPTVAINPVTNSSSIAETPAALLTWRARSGLRTLGRLRSAKSELSLQLEEVLLAEAAHVHQLFDLLERAVLLSVLDDAGRHLRADAGQRLEFCGRRRVDVHDGGRGRRLRRVAAGLCLACVARGGDERQRRNQHDDLQYASNHLTPPRQTG